MILKKQKHRAIPQNGSVPYQLFRKQPAEGLLFRLFSRRLLISYNSFFHRFFQLKWKFSRAEHHKAHHQKCGQFLRYAGSSCYQRHALLAYGVYWENQFSNAAKLPKHRLIRGSFNDRFDRLFTASVIDKNNESGIRARFLRNIFAQHVLHDRRLIISAEFMQAVIILNSTLDITRKILFWNWLLSGIFINIHTYIQQLIKLISHCQIPLHHMLNRPVFVERSHQSRNIKNQSDTSYHLR